MPELKVGPLPEPEPEPEPKAEPRPEPEPEPIGASDDSEWSSTDCSSTDSDASDGSDVDDSEASDDSEEDDLGELPGPSHTIDRQEIAARGGGRRGVSGEVSAESADTSDMMRSQRALLTKLPKTEAETQRIAAAIAGNRARANCSA